MAVKRIVQQMLQASSVELPANTLHICTLSLSHHFNSNSICCFSPKTCLSLLRDSIPVFCTINAQGIHAAPHPPGYPRQRCWSEEAFKSFADRGDTSAVPGSQEAAAKVPKDGDSRCWAKQRPQEKSGTNT
ncbi:hypothetical protein AV530_002075 [Patagioenas fasciata monilis]|uniref:Uncharacterized protein n=1 Tax=Patagioenas fasciata monilis TaxID=372326 RepID=A0A1V4J6J8_PATFA|nr:hypothetical protein AV530_002075 [Patagioenas fasciata monilis]